MSRIPKRTLDKWRREKEDRIRAAAPAMLEALQAWQGYCDNKDELLDLERHPKAKIDGDTMNRIAELETLMDQRMDTATTLRRSALSRATGGA